MMMSDTKAQSALSVTPRGGWRNLWLFYEALCGPDGVVVGPGLMLGTITWPSAEIAEQKALEEIARDIAAGCNDAIEWRGSVFLSEPAP